MYAGGGFQCCAALAMLHSTAHGVLSARAQVMSNWLTGFNESIQAASGVVKPTEDSPKGWMPSTDI